MRGPEGERLCYTCAIPYRQAQAQVEPFRLDEPDTVRCASCGDVLWLVKAFDAADDEVEPLFEHIYATLDDAYDAYTCTEEGLIIGLDADTAGSMGDSRHPYTPVIVGKTIIGRLVSITNK